MPIMGTDFQIIWRAMERKVPSPPNTITISHAVGSCSLGMALALGRLARKPLLSSATTTLHLRFSSQSATSKASLVALGTLCLITKPKVLGLKITIGEIPDSLRAPAIESTVVDLGVFR